jgi:hypothetical protein
VLKVAQVSSDPSARSTRSFLELFKKAARSSRVFGFIAVGEQLIDQF